MNEILAKWGALIVALLGFLWVVRRDRNLESKESLVSAVKAVLAAQGGVNDRIAAVAAAQDRDRATLLAHKEDDKTEFADLKTGLVSIHLSLQRLPLEIVAAIRGK